VQSPLHRLGGRELIGATDAGAWVLCPANPPASAARIAFLISQGSPRLGHHGHPVSRVRSASTTRQSASPTELCVLAAVRDALRRREVYVAGANRWRNPEDDLPGDFDVPERSTTPRWASPSTPRRSSPGCGTRMTGALDRLEAALLADTAGGVRVTTHHGDAWITVPKLERLPEPEQLGALKAHLRSREDPGGTG
jgi:hypothetical protein